MFFRVHLRTIVKAMIVVETPAYISTPVATFVVPNAMAMLTRVAATDRTAGWVVSTRVVDARKAALLIVAVAKVLHFARITVT